MIVGNKPRCASPFLTPCCMQFRVCSISPVPGTLLECQKMPLQAPVLIKAENRLRFGVQAKPRQSSGIGVRQRSIAILLKYGFGRRCQCLVHVVDTELP